MDRMNWIDRSVTSKITLLFNIKCNEIELILFKIDSIITIII